MHLYDDDDDRVLDMGQPMTARRKRLLEQNRARMRPAYEKLARKQLGDDMSQEAIDEQVESMFGGGRIPANRAQALESAILLGVPVALIDRLTDDLALRVSNMQRLENLRTRLRLIGMAAELDELMQGVPARSAARRDAEALKAVLRRRIKDLAW